MSTKEKYKMQIMSYLDFAYDIGLPTLQNSLNAVGTQCITSDKENHYILFGTNSEFYSALKELSEENKIKLIPTAAIVCMMDGGCYDMPVVKNYKYKYKTPHWLPILVRLND